MGAQGERDCRLCVCGGDDLDLAGKVEVFAYQACHTNVIPKIVPQPLKRPCIPASLTKQNPLGMASTPQLGKHGSGSLPEVIWMMREYLRRVVSPAYVKACK